jgi:regulator of protease activity HflC (stomatin/prohibitin superfamily)
VSLQIDGLLFTRIDDAYKASYKIESPHASIRLLALTVMRSEIGKLKLGT